MDIIGNIKISSSNRLFYAIQSIKSLVFLKDFSKLFLNVDGYGFNEITSLFHRIGFQGDITNDTGNFGQVYMKLLERSTANYVMHFEEDHFCELNDLEYVQKICQAKVDAICITFFKYNLISLKNVKPQITNEMYNIYEMNEANFKLFNEKWKRYFLGTNMILSRDFSFKFWGRNIQSRTPHAFEIVDYIEDFKYSLLMPNREILRPIDDDHGIDNTCMIKTPTEKWKRLINEYN